MMKNIGTQQQMQMQQQQQEEAHVEENMSNLTSSAASGGDQASAASSNNGGSNNNNNNNMYRTFSHHLTHQAQQQPNKKKRNQPGNPDPDAEVISLSPHSLLATNRFVCDVCNKGFQRDQNLQLHRRGHNLPWKLKQRNKQDVIRKKVYVCPEISCVHHDPSRALGDLTGIKKHFCRKHGEKKWKCDKCSKKYAVQSDWKAHSKTCGTREYRCDCGTLFSRRDSFITHRAFCDALAEESARNTTTTTNNIISNNNIPLHHVQCSSSATPTMLSHNQINLQHHLQFNNASSVHEQQQQQQQFPLFHIKREQYEQQQQSFTLRHPEMPPWLSCPLPIMGPPQIDLTTTTTPSSTSSIFQDFQQNHDHHHHPNPNPNGTHMGPIFNHPASPHISATALLQKAAQMGSKSTTTTNSSSPPPPGAVFMNMIRPTPHVSAAAADSCLNLSSRDHQLINGLSSYGNKAAAGAVAGANTSNNNNNNNNTSSLLHEMMMMNNPAHPLPNSSFDQEFGSFHAASLGKNSGNHNDQDGMTRDFLGLRPLSQSDFMMSIAGLSNCMNSDGSSVAAAACTEQNQKYLAR